MGYVYLVEKNFELPLFVIILMVEINKRCHLCKPINKNKNGVVGLGLHEICDEIHKRPTMDFQ